MARRAQSAAPAVTRRTVLMVGAAVETMTSVRGALEHDGHRVLTADGGAAALAVLAAEPVQVMVVDQRMAVMSGEELVRRVRARDPLLQVVFQSAGVDDRPARDVLRQLAIHGCHDTGDGAERLQRWIDAALRTYDRVAQVYLAERLKTDLLAGLSHELRTPLNVILGYIDLLGDGAFGPCSPGAAPVLEKIRGNAAYLLQLAEEFLDLSRLEAGGTPLRSAPIALTPFLRELGESFALLIRGKPVRFVVDVLDDLPVVLAEPAKLRIVVQNLLANAAKFTVEGEVRLRAEPLDTTRVVVSVRDTGPGIPVEHHEHVFELFRQLGPRDGSARGVGLGLALARRFARMMGGDITLESEVGKGSTFAAVLPVMPGVSAPPS